MHQETDFSRQLVRKAFTAADNLSTVLHLRHYFDLDLAQAEVWTNYFMGFYTQAELDKLIVQKNIFLARPKSNRQVLALEAQIEQTTTVSNIFFRRANFLALRMEHIKESGVPISVACFLAAIRRVPITTILSENKAGQYELEYEDYRKLRRRLGSADGLALAAMRLVKEHNLHSQDPANYYDRMFLAMEKLAVDMYPEIGQPTSLEELIWQSRQGKNLTPKNN
ncbi:hypothetical protein M1563_04255 [Patescibacteria group bacterium]|nr:hypothetical protein [Patescibacteria group bacterium]MCL5409562.1 hypothetical protein [Patescibacteria group bacterium]